MALDFPSTPTIGDIFTAPNGVTYEWDGVKWIVQGSGGGGGGAFLPLTGGTLTGPLTVDAAATINQRLTVANTFWLGDNATQAQVIMDSPSGFACTIDARTGNNPRWTMNLGDNIPETGGNAGSNFSLSCYNDTTGALLATPFLINRADGYIHAGGSMSIGSSAPVIPVDRENATLGVAEYVTMIGGHYAWNAYIPTPGTEWKHLSAGFAGMVYQDAVAGSILIDVSPSDVAGAVIGTMTAYEFDQGGYFHSSTGIIPSASASGYYLSADIIPDWNMINWAAGWWDGYQRSNGTRIWMGSNPALNTQQMILDPVGNLYLHGIVTSSDGHLTPSDEREKIGVAEAMQGLDEILQINPIVFTRVDTERQRLGFSAQQMKDVLPHAVVEYDRFDDVITSHKTPALAIEDMAVTAALVNAVKELAARLTAGGL
jgi:hypothetical protein